MRPTAMRHGILSGTPRLAVDGPVLVHEDDVHPGPPMDQLGEHIEGGFPDFLNRHCFVARVHAHNCGPLVGS